MGAYAVFGKVIEAVAEVVDAKRECKPNSG